MGLHIKQPWWLKTQGIVTLIAVFALAIQPVGGFVSSLVANAVPEPEVGPRITHVDAYYTKSTGYTGVSVDFKTEGILKAQDISSVKLSLNDSSDGEHSIYGKEPVFQTIYNNAGTDVSTTGTIIISGTRISSSQSWEDMTGTWKDSQRPTEATVTIVVEGEESPLSESSSISENKATWEQVYETVPQITHVDAYYGAKPDYTSIGVDFKTKNITNAASIKLQANRTEGQPYFVEAMPTTVTALNNASDPTLTSGPIVISGSRASSSWTNQTGKWVGSEAPESVDVIITLRNGNVLEFRDDTIGENKATWSQVNVDMAAPTATPELTGVNVVDGTRYVRPGDTLKYTVNATDSQSEIERASNIVFKLLANEKTQNGILCGSWSNGKYPAGATRNFTMKACNGGTAPADGPYGLAFRVYDTAGNSNRIPNIVFHVDGTAPTTSKSDFSAPNISSKSLELSAKATDTGSGVESMRFYIAETQNGECKNNYSAISKAYSQRIANPVDGKYNASISTANLASGEYCVLVSARDNVKNNSTPLYHKVTIDNTPPKIMSVEMSEVKSHNGLNLTGLKLNSNKLAVTFTTNEPLKVSRSQVSLRVPAISNAAPATGWTGVQKVGENKYVANIDLVNSTNSSVNSNWKNFFIDKFYEDINLYFQLTDELDNNKNTYYAVDPVTGDPIDGWTTDSKDERNYKFTLDNKAPIVTIDSPEENKLMSGAVDIFASIADENLSHYYLLVKSRIDSTQGWTTLHEEKVDSDEFSEKKLYTVPNTVNGEVVVLLEAKDKAGNKHSTRSVKKINFDMDNTKPTVKLLENQTQKPSGSYFKTSEDIRIQPQDTNIGSIFINDDELEQYYGKNSFIINWYFAQNPTTEKFIVVAKDKAGNVSDENIIMIDRTAPTININTGTGATNGSLGTHPDYRQISFKLYDKNKNLKEAELNGHIYIRDGEWNDLNWVNINKSHLIQGENTIIVRDIEGNSSELKFNFDSVAPSAEYAYSNNGNVTPNDVTVTMTTSEPVKTPSGWNKVDDRTFTKVFSQNGGFEVVLSDLAGNTVTVGGKQQGAEVKGIDKDAPIFNISNGDIFNTPSKLVSIKEENIKTVTVNGATVTDFSRAKPYEFTVTGEGSHIVVATDKAGHESTVTFVIDSIDPVVPVIIPGSQSIKNSQVFKLAPNDSAISTNVEVSATFSGQPVDLSAVWQTNSDGTYTLLTSTLKNGTKVVLKATATDKANNTSVKTETYTVQNDAPSVSIVSLTDSGNGIFVLNGTSGFAADSIVTVEFNDQIRTGFTLAGGSWSVEVGELAAETPYNFFVTIRDNALNYNRTVGPFPHLIPPVEGSVVERVAAASAVFIPGSTEPVEIAGDETSRPTVLGSEDSRVQGDSTSNTAALTPSEEGWKLFDTAWYWWLAALAAIIGFFWWLAGAIRRRKAEEA